MLNAWIESINCKKLSLQIQVTGVCHCQTANYKGAMQLAD